MKVDCPSCGVKLSVSMTGIPGYHIRVAPDESPRLPSNSERAAEIAQYSQRIIAKALDMIDLVLKNHAGRGYLGRPTGAQMKMESFRLLLCDPDRDSIVRAVMSLYRQKE